MPPGIGGIELTDAGPRGVFLSYASQDAEAARCICEVLRAGGIEVWFDQSELRGGDAWDQSIRRQIKTCALFIPVVSRHTHDRAEGYFRLEWKLAVDRSHLIMANKAFLLPVVVDQTRDDDANVPREVTTEYRLATGKSVVKTGDDTFQTDDGRLHLKACAFGRKQHVRQDRDRVSPLHHAMHMVERFQEIGAFEDYTHDELISLR